MKLVLLKAWTDSIDVASIDPASISPGTLEKLLVEAAPMLQKLVFNIIVSIIIFIVGRRLISILLKILNKFLSHVEMDEGVNKFLQSAARMLLYILLIFMIVGQLGVSTASIVTILGAGGLAISMSLQGSLSNVAGGILILLMSAMEERRLDIEVGISYDSDIRKAKEVMEEVYRNCPGYLPEKGVNVHVSQLGDSSVGIEGQGWVKGSEFLASKWYVMENVKLEYDAHGIQIPFPQMDVHMDTVNSQETGQNKA